MASFGARARRLAFGYSNEDVSDVSSTRSSIRSVFSTGSNRALIGRSSNVSEMCTCLSHEKAAHIAPRRTDRVRRINRSQPVERFADALVTDGCVIVEDFINPQILQRVHEAEDISETECSNERESWSLKVDVHSLIRESLALDSLYQELSWRFLALEIISWQNKQAEVKAVKPRLSSSSTRDLNNKSGAPCVFHRADSVYHNRHAAATRCDYQRRRDVALGLFVPELDSLSATISVQAIPGSHRWGDQKPEARQGVKETQLRSGDALILLGSLYHHVGANGVERPVIGRCGMGTPKEKLMHELWMCTGIYRSASEIEVEDAEA